MARQRDHAAEYARKQELARERGHQTAYEERKYRAAVKSEPGGGAVLKLTQGRKTSDPGALAQFRREYRPGSMKIDQLKARVRDLLSTSPPYDAPDIPQGVDLEEVLDLYSAEGYDDDYVSDADYFGGLPFDQFSDEDWDTFFESDDWYDFLDSLYDDA